MNACMREKTSCSACCGIHNLRLSFREKEKWLETNTQLFLQLDIAVASEIVSFRKEREKLFHKKKIRPDIYVCPFLGLLENNKTGCLLHPKGSPHPKIKHWKHPQSFSFYGEGICQSFDCFAKEYKLNHALSDSMAALDYSYLASHYNLLAAINQYERMRNVNVLCLKLFFIRTLKSEGVPITGFEPTVKLEKTEKGLLHQIAMFLCKEWFMGQDVPDQKLAAMKEKIEEKIQTEIQKQIKTNENKKHPKKINNKFITNQKQINDKVK